MLTCLAVDQFRFLVTGVILPEPRIGIRIVPELLMGRERNAVRIDGDGCAPGGIDANPDNRLGVETGDALRILDRAGDRRLQPSM